jgi:hypothetical protein
MRARNGREQDGRVRRVRRKLDTVTVAIEFVKNEEERTFIYTWEGKATPLGCFPSVNTQAKLSISRGEHF